MYGHALIFRPDIHEDWDPHLKDLLAGMFKKDPSERLAMRAIRVRT